MTKTNKIIEINNLFIFVYKMHIYFIFEFIYTNIIYLILIYTYMCYIYLVGTKKSAHPGCIYLIKNTVKYSEILLQFKITVFCLNIL